MTPDAPFEFLNREGQGASRCVFEVKYTQYTPIRASKVPARSRLKQQTYQVDSSGISTAGG